MQYTKRVKDVLLVWMITLRPQINNLCRFNLWAAQFNGISVPFYLNQPQGCRQGILKKLVMENIEIVLRDCYLPMNCLAHI